MDKEKILKHFKTLTIWKSGDKRAPHKPLLVLLAIGFLQNKDQRLIPYNIADNKLERLLVEFGTPRNAKNTHYPFWRLRKEKIWEIPKENELLVNNSGDVRKTELREKNIKGGFTPDVYQLLKTNSIIRNKIIYELLYAHFPKSLHEDIILETGLELDKSYSDKKIRDPKFRREVMQAYQYRCAVCNFDVRMGSRTICLEAAHIKWHSAGGPDSINNGICLCTLHHKLFDLGAFTFNTSRQLMVSERAVGTDGFKEWLGRFHGEEVTKPIRAVYEPSVEYIAWNIDQVFKNPGRTL